MEYRFYRELKHNYLILENSITQERSDDDYQYNIAGSGRIKELIPISIRNINGKKYYYYEINSMQNLTDRYSVGGMKADEVIRLLGSVKSLLENLSEFLMSDESIVFSAKNIYTDLSSGEFGFMFCPFFDEAKGFESFAMELLELVDDDDEKATGIVYSLCEKASVRGDFVYQIIDEVLSDKEKVPETERISPAGYKEERIETYMPEDDISLDVEEEYMGDPTEDNRMERSQKRLGGRMQLLFSLLFGGVVGAMVYIRMHYVLSEQENLLSILVMLLSAVTGVVALVGGFRDMKGEVKYVQKQGGKEKKENKVRELKETKREPEEDTDDLWGSENMHTYQDLESDLGLEKPVKDTIDVSRKSSLFVSEASCGETVVLDENLSEEMALFSRNLDRTVRIALGNLPITVGKMEGCVDRVLNDVSISRMHCKFIGEGDRVAVLDLGSTNGTYRNGVRLRPREKTYIEEGDEIRIGRVCFDCR